MSKRVSFTVKFVADIKDDLYDYSMGIAQTPAGLERVLAGTVHDLIQAKRLFNGVQNMDSPIFLSIVPVPNDILVPYE